MKVESAHSNEIEDESCRNCLQAVSVMESLYRRLKESPGLFKNIELTENNEIAITTGCLYFDKTDIILYINENDYVFTLTDKGRTRTYMDKIFELKENDVIKNIVSTAKYYGISTKNQKLSLESVSISAFHKDYLRMLYCIGFLDTMRIFYE